MSNYAILEITDGTSANTINLLSPGFGYHLKNWQQSRPDIEFNMSTNWFSGNQQPTSYVMNPQIEPFTFAANEKDTDSMALLQAKFNRILIMAARFWTGDREVPKPFYIRAKGKYETYERYGTILVSKMHPSGNPYAQPYFSQKPADDNLVVAITHSGWRDFVPGSSKDITDQIHSQLSSKRHPPNVYGILQGSPTDKGQVIIANFYSEANISHVFRDANAVNLQNHEFSSWTEALLIHNSTTDSYTYFGSETTPLQQHKRFNNLVFNLWPFATPSSPILWEYWDAVQNWLPLTGQNPGYMRGNPDLDPSGEFMFTWDIPPSWQERDVNGVTGYWVRINNASEDIYQVGYPVYSATWPYMDIKNNTPGDLGIALDIGTYSPVAENNDQYKFDMDRIIIGAKEIPNAWDFVSHLSVGLDTLQDDIRFDLTSNGPEPGISKPSVIASGNIPGTYILYRDLTSGGIAGTECMALVSIGFDRSYAFSGYFRAFARVGVAANFAPPGDVIWWLGVYGTGGTQNRVVAKTPKVTDGLSSNHVTVLDLGSIYMGGDNRTGYGISGNKIEHKLALNYSIIAADIIPYNSGLIFYDIVLIPQDVWFADISLPGALDDNDYELIVSSATTPADIFTTVRNRTSDATLQSPVINPGRSLELFTNNNIRLYFMMFHDWYVGHTQDIATVTPERPRRVTSFNYFLANGEFRQVNRFAASRGNQGFSPE